MGEVAMRHSISRLQRLAVAVACCGVAVCGGQGTTPHHVRPPHAPRAGVGGGAANGWPDPDPASDLDAAIGVNVAPASAPGFNRIEVAGAATIAIVGGVAQAAVLIPTSWPCGIHARSNASGFDYPTIFNPLGFTYNGSEEVGMIISNAVVTVAAFAVCGWAVAVRTVCASAAAPGDPSPPQHLSAHYPDNSAPDVPVVPLPVDRYGEMRFPAAALWVSRALYQGFCIGAVGILTDLDNTTPPEEGVIACVALSVALVLPIVLHRTLVKGLQRHIVYYTMHEEQPLVVPQQLAPPTSRPHARSGSALSSSPASTPRGTPDVQLHLLKPAGGHQPSVFSDDSGNETASPEAAVIAVDADDGAAYDTTAADAKSRRNIRLFFGPGEWVDRSKSLLWGRRYAIYETCTPASRQWWCLIDMGYMFTVAALEGMAHDTATTTDCGHHKAATATLSIVMCLIVMVKAPYHRPRDQWMMGVVYALQAVAAAFMAAAYYNARSRQRGGRVFIDDVDEGGSGGDMSVNAVVEEDPPPAAEATDHESYAAYLLENADVAQYWGTDAAGALLLIAATLLVVKAILDLLCNIMCARRRADHQQQFYDDTVTQRRVAARTSTRSGICVPVVSARARRVAGAMPARVMGAPGDPSIPTITIRREGSFELEPVEMKTPPMRLAPPVLELSARDVSSSMTLRVSMGSPRDVERDRDRDTAPLAAATLSNGAGLVSPCGSDLSARTLSPLRSPLRRVTRMGSTHPLRPMGSGVYINSSFLPPVIARRPSKDLQPGGADRDTHTPRLPRSPKAPRRQWARKQTPDVAAGTDDAESRTSASVSASAAASPHAHATRFPPAWRAVNSPAALSLLERADSVIE